MKISASALYTWKPALLAGGVLAVCLFILKGKTANSFGYGLGYAVALAIVAGIISALFWFIGKNKKSFFLRLNLIFIFLCVVTVMKVEPQKKPTLQTRQITEEAQSYSSIADEQREKAPEWATKNVDCSGTKEDFLWKYLEAIGQAEPSYFTNITEISYLVYFVIKKQAGIKDPFDQFEETDVLNKTNDFYYELCKKSGKFNLISLAYVEKDIRKAYPEHSKEFQETFAPVLRQYLRSIHNSEEDALRERLKDTHQRARDLME